jgi:hypothetical protein
MKHWYLTLLILVGIAGKCSAGAVLDVDESTFYFGAVPQFSKIYHHYWFRSTGTDTVVIDSINTACSCVILDADSLRIPPGDSTRVTIIWDIGRRMNMLGQATDIFYNHSYVPKNIGMRAFVRMNPKSNIPFTIIPYRFEFGQVPGSEISVDSVRFEIVNTLAHPINIEVISDPLEGLNIVLPDSIDANKSGYGYAKLGPQLSGKAFDYSVTFQISDDQKSRFTVPIRRKIYK